MEYFVTIGVIMVGLSFFLDVDEPFIPALIITVGLHSFGIIDNDDEKIAKATVASTQVQEQTTQATKKTANTSTKKEEKRVVIWTEEDDKRVNYECWDCGQQTNNWNLNNNTW